MIGAFIAWSAFTWEAFATLVTGILAVGGAFLLGRRQIQILERQAEIENLSLRSELFERRYSVYDRIRQLVGKIVEDAKMPDSDIQQSFLEAKGEAAFLFDSYVVAGIDEIWQKASLIPFLQRKIEAEYTQHNKYSERERDELIWFEERLTTLPDLFQDMKLGGNLMVSSQ